MRLPVALLLCLGVPGGLFGASPALTIYNQDFAVIRDMVPLKLKAGINSVQYAEMTANAEADSVVLRDPEGKVPWQVLEQNYRTDTASVDRLLERYQGQVIQFEKPDGKIVSGRIVRASPPSPARPTGPYNVPVPEHVQVMIEIEGQLRFGLPGTPLFPTDGHEVLLHPTMQWRIRSDRDVQLQAELGYISGGLTWKADYNVVSTERDDQVDLVGWITMENHSGKSFPDAQIALMAGDVNKKANPLVQRPITMSAIVSGPLANPTVVTEKPFDDYHLYQLGQKATLLDGEVKQVELVRANGIPTKRVFLYDGADMSRYHNMYMGYEQIRNNAEYGIDVNSKVWIMREFTNSAANHLGMPLPKGRLRFYRQDTNGRLEFTGENDIDHTPREETIRVFTGAAFDVVGSRKRTEYHNDFSRREANESFEISVHNRKTVPVQVLVREHLYRGATWTILSETDPHVQRDTNTIEFPITIRANVEKIVHYSVQYTW